MLRKHLPSNLKLRYRVARRYLSERVRHKRRFAVQQQAQLDFAYQQLWQLEIKPSSLFANKVHNIDLCLQRINGLLIQPHEVFSFWQLIPQPSAKNGFKSGRNLRAGQIAEEIGGGICQVSCIVYILALKNGFDIIERHAHSVDIYQEHERFTPLGSDATVVYGYKDLQFQNPFDFPVAIECWRQDTQLFCCFHSDVPLPDYDLEFKTDLLDSGKQVLTYVNGVMVNQSLYRYADSH